MQSIEHKKNNKKKHFLPYKQHNAVDCNAFHIGRMNQRRQMQNKGQFIAIPADGRSKNIYKKGAII